VKACFHVTGRYDYILHVAARDIEHLGMLVKHKIAAIGGVEKQETFLVLSTVKEDDGFSLAPLFDERAEEK
jgi:Lrp/AsnC family transcriptional regulator, leucine-responsive regulatory protein